MIWPLVKGAMLILAVCVFSPTMSLWAPMEQAGAADRPTSFTQPVSSNPWVWKDIEGKSFDLQNGNQDTLTVVIFVSTDCPIANAFQPTLRELQSGHSDRGVKFVQVHPTSRTTVEMAKKHQSDFRIDSSVVLDPERRIAKLLKAKVTPEAFLLDANAKILYRGRINDLYVGFGKKRRKPQNHDLANAIQLALVGEMIETKMTKAIGCLIPQD